MNNIYKFLIILLFILLNNCSKGEKVTVIIEEDLELQMIEAYSQAINSLKDGDALFAAKRFNEAETLYPQSDWAPRASLMAAYSYYSQNYWSDAIFELERYMKVYPKDKNLAYGHFLLGMTYYEMIVDEKKDLEPLLKAKKEFNYIIENYPNTDFAIDGQFKLGLIHDIMASKEMYLAKHYMKKEKWIAAINRFKTVVEDYETTIYVEEAIHRLVEIHYKIGLIDESKKYANLLGYNYLSGEWYKKSYSVFNKNYKTPLKKKKKKKQNFIKKKFKSLFDIKK